MTAGLTTVARSSSDMKLLDPLNYCFVAHLVELVIAIPSLRRRRSGRRHETTEAYAGVESKEREARGVWANRVNGRRPRETGTFGGIG